MPVDTFLKGKNLTRYMPLEIDGVRVLVAPALQTWAERLIVDASKFLFWRKFEVAVAHRHQPT